MQHSYLQSLLGGSLIGLSAAVLLLVNGRIAGVSGMISGAIGYVSAESFSRLAFLVGLFCGPWVYHAWFGVWPTVEVTSSMAVMIAAGVLVGFGTRLGSGCTSGHGVCGFARLSPRSILAVGVFLSAGVATVFLMHKVGL